MLFHPNFHIPMDRPLGVLGFLQDFFAVAVLLGIITFAIIRLRSGAQGVRPRVAVLRLPHRRRLADPVHDLQRHLDLRVLPRCGRQHRQLPVRQVPRSSPTRWACAAAPARAARQRDHRDRRAAAAHRRDAGVPADRAALQAPAHRPGTVQRHVQAAAQRAGPAAAGGVRGQAHRLRGSAEDAVFGRGKIEDFTWKGTLDFTTCTECGRCQSQCPAWNTGKPLSPKLVIMDLRDHCWPRRHTSSARSIDPLDTEARPRTRPRKNRTTCRSPASGAFPARTRRCRPPGRWSETPQQAA